MKNALADRLDVEGFMRSLAILVTLLYYVIGKVEYEPRMAWGSISANQILQIGVLVALAFTAWTGGGRAVLASRVFGLVALLTLLLAVGGLRAENTAYAPSKIQGYAALVLPVVAVLAGTVRGRADIERFLLVWAILGTGMMLMGLVLLASGAAPPRLAVFGGGANVYARMLGSAILIGFGLVSGSSFGRRGLWAWMLPGFAIALLFAGSKTVVLGIGLGLMVLGWSRHSKRLVFGALAASLAFTSAPLWTHALVQHADKDRGEIRMFRRPDTSDPRGSYGTRLQYYRASLALLERENWTGVGTGDWALALHLPSGRRYPHNMALELGCELGVAGLAILAAGLWFVMAWIRRLRRASPDDRLAGTLMALTVFWLFNAQLSGDLVDNRHIWLSLLFLEMMTFEHWRAFGSARTAADPSIPVQAEAVG